MADKKEKKNKEQKANKGNSDNKIQERRGDITQASKQKKFRISKVYLFAILNAIALILLFYFLNGIQGKADELKELINAEQNAQQSSQVNFADLELKSNKEKADRIIDLFPNDQKLLDFIKIIEDKSDDGTIVNFSFASKEPVRDSTTRLGIPVVVNFRGTWSRVDSDLRDIQSAPFIFRPITIEARNTAETGVIEFMYGGFLYVDESF